MRALTLLLAAALLAGCASTPPTGAREMRLPLDVAGDSHAAHWFVPAGTAQALVVLEHGFSRRCGHLQTTARQIRDQGLLVLCLDAPMAGGNPALADALAATLLGTLSAPDGRPLPQRIVVAGHSAGAAFAARLGARLDQLAPARLAGALLLDPVAVLGFSDHLRTVSEQGRRPVLALRANSSECNARHSASAALHQVHAEAAPGRGFVGVQFTDGSTHIDAEGEDSDLIARVACGQPLPANSGRLRTLAAAWALALAQGELPAAPAEMAGLKLVD